MIRQPSPSPLRVFHDGNRTPIGTQETGCVENPIETKLFASRISPIELPFHASSRFETIKQSGKSNRISVRFDEKKDLHPHLCSSISRNQTQSQPPPSPPIESNAKVAGAELGLISSSVWSPAHRFWDFDRVRQ